MYPGDSKFRVSTQQNKKKRVRSTSGAYGRRGRLSATTVSSSGSFCVEVDKFREAVSSGQICDDVTKLASHLCSFERCKAKCGNICHWCGETTYTKCTKCNVALHNFPIKGEHRNKSCSLYYHDPNCFGLGYWDCKTLKSRKGITWQIPSAAAKQANKDHINGTIIPTL